jgi:hypothetical protein
VLATDELDDVDADEPVELDEPEQAEHTATTNGNITKKGFS